MQEINVLHVWIITNLLVFLDKMLVFFGINRNYHMESITKTFSTLLDESPRCFITALENFNEIYGASVDDSDVQKESEDEIKDAIAATPVLKMPEHETSIAQSRPDHVLRKLHAQLLEELDHERTLITECDDNIAIANAFIKYTGDTQVPPIQRAENVGNDFKIHKTIFKSMIERLFPQKHEEMMKILGDLMDFSFEPSENKYIRLPTNTTPALLDALEMADLIDTDPEHDSRIKLKKIL